MNSGIRVAWQIVRHDQRLLWREMNQGTMGMWRTVVPLGVLLLLIQAPALMLFWQLKNPPLPGIMSVFWVIVGLGMLFGATNRSLILLYEKSDLDLLFSAPQPSYVILLGRLCSIAAIVFVVLGLFVLPVMNAELLRFGPRFLPGFLVWALLALIAAAIGTTLILGLVRLFGVRRGRFVGQLLAISLVFAPLSVMLLPTMLSPARQKATWSLLLQIVHHPAVESLGRAAQGGLPELAGLMALAAVVVGLTARLMARTFLAGAQEITVTSGARHLRPHHWVDGLLRALIWKEVRLLTRHQMVLNALLPTSLLVAVVGGVIVGKTGVRALAPVTLYWSGLVTMQLAIFAAAGEVGWDLVRQSVVPELRVYVLKTVVTVILALTPLLIPWIWLAVAGHPGLALLSGSTALVCGSATAWLGVCTTQPSPRQDVFPQAKGKSLVLQMAGMMLSMAAAAAVALVGADLVGLGLASLGGLLLGALACFTLVEPDLLKPSA